MTSPLRVDVQQATFGSASFWRRLERLAAEQGHDGHQLQLAGFTEPKDVYEYRCLRCERALVEVTVKRAA